MKLFVEKEKMTDNPNGFLRSQGYGYIQARGNKQDSYVRRLSSTDFPRLHMYVNDRGEKWEFHLHLDQKPVSYKGVSAHSGEYEGPIVATEIERLSRELGVSLGGGKQTTNNEKSLIQNSKGTQRPILQSGGNAEEKLGQGSLDDIKPDNKKIPFWKKNIF